MVEEIVETEAVKHKRPVGVTIVKWIAIALLAIVLIIGAILFGLNTAPGKRFIADQVEAYEMENGLKIGIGELKGSIYGKLVIEDLRLSDPKGVFVTSPQVTVDWRPFAFVGNHVDIRSLTSPLITLQRLPELNDVPIDPNDPYLPDIDIDVAKLKIDQFIIEEAVAGKRSIASLSGRAKIADQRAQIFADAATVGGPELAGGDKLKLVLDAVPDDNKLDIDAKIYGPDNGLIAALAGLNKPVKMNISGKGDWAKWNGQAVASLGGDNIARISLAARSGKFAVKGAANPALFFEGPTAALMSPALNIDVTAAFSDRVADTKVQLSADAFRASAEGKIDFAQSEFRNLLVDFQLLKPSTLAPDLVGRGITAAANLNGAFAAPVVNYRVNAAMIGFGETQVQQFSAAGVTEFDPKGTVIPVSAKAARITGLNEAAGGLLTNVSFDGDIAVQGSRILSDNLRIRSDKLNATAIILADMEKGLYTGAIDGRVNDYRIESVGIFNVDADIDLEAGANGQYALKGTVSARSSRLFNEGVQDFLGGNMLLTSNVSYGSDGVARINGLRVASPSFKLTNGNGTYTSSGGITFDASAYSNAYGPLGVQVSGTIARPVAYVQASRPGVGIGLVDLRAAIRGDARGYAVKAQGGTDYGPFDADVLIASGRGPLAVDINSLLFAGVNFEGRVVQSVAGPFTGKLRGAGSGIATIVNLSAPKGVQRADFTARADNAVVPGAANVRIGRAIIDGYVVLYNSPLVKADVQLAQTRYGEYFINAARAEIDYRGGKGTAKILAEGNTGVPFRVAANANFDPKLWRVALDGRANSINFKTKSPARIIPERNAYKLLPTTIDLGKGTVRVAGNYGSGLKLQSRLENLDLSLINTLYPGTGINGTATGSLDFEQNSSNALPESDARLVIKNFTRTSLAAISKPVDVNFVGRLLPNGGNASALIRQRGTTIGRMKASLTPLPPGSGSWTTRLMAAPLSGGIRYNGPAEAVFSLAGLAGQNLTGPLGLAADFSGRVQSPILTGVVRANNLTYENETYGTRLTNMKVSGRFAQDTLTLSQLSATAGEGTITGNGTIGLAADSGYPIDLKINLNKARLARSDDLSSTASGQLNIINNASQGALIKGNISLPETRYKVIYQGSAEVAQLTGIRRKPPRGMQRMTGDRKASATAAGIWKLDIRVKADNRIFISGMGLESEWATDLRITGRSDAPRVSGGVELIRGTYSFSGRRFVLDEGIITFNGGALTNPQIRISAEAEIDDITAILKVSGSAQDPQIAFSANPSLPQDEVISRILFGSSVQNLSAIQAVQLASSLNSLRGGGGGLNPLGSLRSATGFDRLSILGADKDSGRGTAISAGKYLTDDIYLEVITDSKGFTATQLEIALTKSLSVLSHAGSFGETNVNVRYSKDY